MSSQEITHAIDELKKQAVAEQGQCRADITAVISDLRGKIAKADAAHHKRMTLAENDHKALIAGLTETVETFQDMLVKVEGAEMPEIDEGKAA